MPVPDLTWIDEFYRHIRPLIFVRREDNLLIIVPNQAYRLNASALALLEEMARGRSVADCVAGLGDSDGRRQDVHDFFCDLRAALTGCLREGAGRRAVELVPYALPFNTLPVLSEIAVTYRCNLSCRFCYAGCTCRRKAAAPRPSKRKGRCAPARDGEEQAGQTDASRARGRCGRTWRASSSRQGGRGGPHPDEMTTDQVKRVIEIIRHEAQVPSVSFTGGEPTLRDDLPDLVQAARSLGLRVNLITNGVRLSRDGVKALVEAGLNSAQVSLESASPSQHDWLTQRPGSWERTLCGVQNLVRAGVTCHINTTLTAPSAPYAPNLVNLACEMGLSRLSMNMVIPTGSGSANRDLWLRYREIGPVIEAVRRRAQRLGVEFLWYSPTPYCLYNPVANGLGNKGCAACDGLLSVSPTGEVLPCSSLPKSVGNLLKTDFRRIWNGRRARHWRRKDFAHAKCRACEKFDLCTGACPIYWQALGFEELLEAPPIGADPTPARPEEESAR